MIQSLSGLASGLSDSIPFGIGFWAESFNPEGIGSFSPGLARFREGLPWVAAFKVINPERVEYQPLTNQIQPFQGCDYSVLSPRVARSSQPWAERLQSFQDCASGLNQCNPFRIARLGAIDSTGLRVSIPKGLDHSAQGWPDSERAYPGWLR